MYKPPKVSIFTAEEAEKITDLIHQLLMKQWEAKRAELKAKIDQWAPSVSLDDLAAWSPTSLPQPAEDVRCRECGHHLTAATSMSAGIGPVCRQRRSGADS